MARKVTTERIDDGLEPVVRARATVHAEPVRAERQVDVVAENQNLLGGIELEEVYELTHAFAGAVHERRRLHEEHGLSIQFSFGHVTQKLLFVLVLPCFRFFGQKIERHPTCVVTRELVLFARVAQTDDEEFRFHWREYSGSFYGTERRVADSV